MDSRDIGIMSDWGHSTIVVILWWTKNVWRYQMGNQKPQMGNQKPQMEERPTIEWPKEKGQNTSQKITNLTKQTPWKTGN